jgi:hypothetical protein
MVGLPISFTRSPNGPGNYSKLDQEIDSRPERGENLNFSD